MRALRNSLLALAATAAFVVPTAVLTSSASAISCPAHKLCVSGNGARGEFETGVYDLGGFGSGKLNDHVVYVNNATDKTWCLYSDAGYNGDAHVVTSGFNAALGDFGNKVSSMRPRPWYGC
jgi:hypothetical protein